ncbi:ectoine/hydroxyectoine ABC transporter ATP-binding protein EhuA [Rhodoferax koreense]|uniref:Ectoine/hydroxyectoine ABC transporter ATP-binding protein EhuA n=1 Tax=Rhodoferax koreensis TaxID=1842727 RepID=A0A1P8K0S5_9BURK|nr:amino acid ABC transporter ATP-binding protein [Rhodoferax koreense]APW39614.1 ectoine/hydroxyectoine ABC transporter ATP-binding protein EhuA [Rhodoferax koreense]
MNHALEPAVAAIRCEGLCQDLGGQRVLQGIDLAVAKGEVVSVLGPSGSGKSTLLRCLNWLAPPTAGRVWLGNEEVGVKPDRHGRQRPLADAAVRAQRSRIGMVFQSFNLWPHMTALENVMEGLLSVKRLARAEAHERAAAALREVGLGHKLDSHPARLSGGQQQRVAIARTIAMQPEVILFDEPTSALDPELVGEVLGVMRELALRHTTMIVVTHEIAFADGVCDRVVFMDQGRIVEQGPPAQVLRAPQQERTQRFLGRFADTTSAR